MPSSDQRLTTEQAYEAAYRFVEQYYERERIVAPDAHAHINEAHL